jgi:ADP-ribose pyrophosphatase
MWQVLTGETLIDDPTFNVIKEKVRTNTGDEIEWYRLEEQGGRGACIIARNEQGQILLQREYTYPLQDWIIDFPGGGVDADEDLVEGANRELAEEAGYRGANLVEIGTYISNRRRSTAIMHVFLATDLSVAESEKDKGEEIESFWATETELDAMILKGEILSPRVLSGWLYYKLFRDTAKK